MSRVGDDSGTPRALVHKKILDVAASNPDASMEAIAAEVSGASTDLVERVLDEYGDPCETQGSEPAADGEGTNEHPTQSTQPTTETMSDLQTESEEPNENGAVDRSELSDKQLATLRAIAADPDCSQAELAEEFDVTRATISRWVNDIPGFEWSRRGEFAARIVGAGGGGSAGNGDRAARNGDGNEDAGPGASDASDDGASAAAGPDAADESGDGTPEAGDTDAAGVDELRDRLADLERRLDDRAREGTPEEATGDGSGGLPVEPDLAHRVVHACMASDRISEAEELRLLELFMDADRD
ncbi:MAG: MarR family transcriptional regulator [Haloarculaceae archaeon]